MKITGPKGPVVAPRRKPVAAVGRLVAVAGLVGLGRARRRDEPPRSLPEHSRSAI